MRYLMILSLSLFVACGGERPKPPPADTTITVQPDTTAVDTAIVARPDSIGAEAFDSDATSEPGVEAEAQTGDYSDVEPWVAPPDRRLMASASGNTFGAWGLFRSGAPLGPLNMSNTNPSPSSLLNDISTARNRGLRLVLALTGGPHTANNMGCCLSRINGVVQFDRAKWNAVMQKFNTSTIRTAIANAMADGTIVGANVMDEPYVHGTGDGNTWGPAGTMTKAKVDDLCRVVQTMFPTLPAGVTHNHKMFDPTHGYHVCSFIIDGPNGEDLSTFRAGALAIAARDHHSIMFNLNVLNGGRKDTDGNYNCTGTDQAGVGTMKPLCRRTAANLRAAGLALGPAGCGLIMWTYDYTYWHRADNQSAMKDIGAAMAAAPRRPCRRF